MSSMDADYKIIENILNGKKEEFEMLVDKYQNKVFGIVSRRVPYSDVPDLAQEAFLKAYRGLGNFRPQSGNSFESWLSVITLRCCYDFWRRQARSREALMPVLDNEKHAQWLENLSADISMEAFSKLSRAREAKELLDWALTKVPPDDRTLIEMVYWEGYSFIETAEVLEWKLSKTKVRALRAKKKLKKLIAEYMELVYHE